MKDSSDYHQPEFYHFSEDSIILANHALEKLPEDISNFKVIDLCCGCGVVGLEFYSKLGASISKIEFCELQEEYKPYFEHNLKFLTSEQRETVHFNLDSFTNYLESDEKYDLIISNPPYFDEMNHRPSPNKNKNLCRLFVDTTFEDFFKTVLHLLSDRGQAHFLIRLDKHHGNKSWKMIEDVFNAYNKSKKYELSKVTLRGAELVSVTALHVD